MEHEMKLKQVEQQQVDDKQIAAKQDSEQMNSKQFDENNNNNNQKEEQLSEGEEWRSLSPNLEPSSAALLAAAKRQPETRTTSDKFLLAADQLSQFRELQEQRVNFALMQQTNESCSSNELASDESQLMSIDPSICRPPNEDHGVRTEEQSANEEFSSSSSSFGSTSLAQLEQRPVATKSSLPPHAEDSDEQTSTQSGSVLTVVANQPTSSSTISASEPETSSSQMRDTSTSMSLISSLAESEAQQVAADQEQTEMDGRCAYIEDEQPASNIGVAFESLHFDTEIKSSKSEPLDHQQLLLGCPPQESIQELEAAKLVRRQPPSARELRSVCSLISAAISDADQQILACGTREPSPRGLAQQQEQVVEEPKAAESMDGVERATFEDESSPTNGPVCPQTSPRFRDNREDAVQSPDSNQQDEPTIASQDSDSFPRADLSSIFEANVRREIERFETDSMARKPSHGSNGRLISKSGLTEWRIAEEIRLLKERELELKNRVGLDGNSMATSRANASAGRMETNQQAEAIVRFGKTIQLPKSVASSNPQLVTKSIKLSTSVSTTNWQQSQHHHQSASTISMHKFVANGGKRFIFANGRQDAGNDSSASNQRKLSASTTDNQLTKSMSNLCIVTSRATCSADKAHDSPRAQRQTDTKFADGHKGRNMVETDISGVKRADSSSRSNLRNSDSQSRGQKLTANGQQPSPASHHQSLLPSSTSTTSSCSSCSSNSVGLSAEWKIQEELREMRLREAELRNQRNLSLKQNPALVNKNHLLSDGLKNQDGSVDSDKASDDPANEDTIDSRDKLAEGNNINESLYPIKQAIDSFRKLSDSTQNATNSHNMVPLPQQNSATSISRKFQWPTNQEIVRQDQVHANSTNDYDFKVGKERRKISMIDKWESGQI